MREKPKPDQLTDSTIRLDPAMQRRDWDASVAAYPNGSVVAGPTEFPFEPKRSQPYYTYYGADAGTFFMNLFAVPVALVLTPPWTAQTYPGAVIPPTSTAVPTLPPTRAPQPHPVRQHAAPPRTPAATQPAPTFVPVPSPSTQGLPPAIRPERGATTRPTNNGTGPSPMSTPASRPAATTPTARR